jgi:hypothetical protein
MKKPKFDIQPEDIKLLPRNYLEKLILDSVIFSPFYSDAEMWPQYLEGRKIIRAKKAKRRS